LSKPWHFEKVIGTQIWVKLNSSLEKYGCTDGKYKPAKSITEDLVGIDNGNLKFMLSGQEIVIPMAEISSAKVSFNFDKKKEKPGHKKDHKKAKN
jgi:ribosome maturation factor RimP